MSDYTINLICCTDTICDELTHKGVTRKGVALSYDGFEWLAHTNAPQGKRQQRYLNDASVLVRANRE